MYPTRLPSVTSVRPILPSIGEWIFVKLKSRLALCSAALAFAHPALVSSTPKSGEALASPTELRLRFSEPIEPAFTHVELVDPGGLELKVGALSAIKDDANAITIVLPALPPGIYKARWSAAGRDGHRVKGEFSFTVK